MHNKAKTPVDSPIEHNMTISYLRKRNTIQQVSNVDETDIQKGTNQTKITTHN